MNISPNALISEALGALTRSEETTSPTEESQTSEVSGEFDTLLKSILGKDDQQSVSEEELFAALLQERVTALKGAETGAKFAELMNESRAALTKPDGYFSYEDSAKASLRALRDGGDLTAEEADKLYSEAFSAAQLDGDTSALFDDRGGPGDATVATQVLEQALLASRVMIEKYTNGEEEAAARSLDEASNTNVPGAAAGLHSSMTASPATGISDPSLALSTIEPNGNTFDGPNGFLFKPISDNQGTLAILMPEVLAYKVAGVTLRDSLGEVVEEGVSFGYGEPGTREKFSFTQQGGSYPKDLIVEVRLHDGTISRYVIPDPSQRYD